ncbi:MAG: hypothetical protein U0R44_02840 [Candidatus Micrarchaeia archaeon]
MAEATRQRTSEVRQAEERAPITIVPTRRALEDRQVTELRAGLARAQQEIVNLNEYFRNIRIPPTARTVQDVTAEADRIDQALARMSLTSNPVLGERYRDELELFTRKVTEARAAIRDGRLARAIEILDQVNLQVGVIGMIFELELGMLINGVPTNVRIEGVAADTATDAIFNGLEGAVLDFGTANEQRGRNVLRVFRLYVLNSGVYNADNPSARAERDQVLGFVVDRGRKAREGVAFSAADSAEDTRLIGSFESNATRLREQIRDYNITVFNSWRTDLPALIQAERDDQARRGLETLQTDVDSILRRLRASQDVSDEEIRSASSRYFLLTGRQPPLSEVERVARIRDAATELRGTRRLVEGSAEWYAQRALDLLTQGNFELASLALSVGLLERSARGRMHAADYISDFAQISDLVTRGISPTPALMSRYLAQIEAGTIAADADRIAADYARSGTREKRERVLDAARVIRERMRSGDMDGARRLLDMTSAYIDLLTRYNWRTWTGSAEMETAIDSERNGANAADRFGNALAYHEVSGEIGRMREVEVSWGRGISAERQIFESVLDRIEALARSGDIREARRGLTLMVMYVDSVQRLGVRRRGKIESLNDTDRLSGMRDGLRAYVRGEATVEGRPAQEVFVESYNGAQRAYITREADRLDALAAIRTIGRDDIQAAITRARERGTAGDFRGAMILLEYVKDFYGSLTQATGTTPLRYDGWRYALFMSSGAGSIPGYVGGRREMLEAIRLEINATDEQTHLAAAQLYQQGANRIAETEYLVARSGEVLDRFAGTTPFIPGEADTRGRIPLGERRDGAYTDYIDVQSVWRYESENASTDPTLRGQPTMAQLTARMNAAARSGDRVQYNRAVAAINARLEIMVRRAVRYRTITQLRDRVGQLRTGLRDVRATYDASVYSSGDLAAGATTRRTAIDALDTRAQAYLTRLDTFAANEEELPLNDFGQLIADANRESRIASSLSFLNNQITSNEQFRQAVAAERSDRAADVARDLQRAGTYFAQARVHLLNGNLEDAYQQYRGAIGHRTQALVFYRAEDSPHIDQVDMGEVIRFVPLPRPRATDISPISGADLRFFPQLRASYALHGVPGHPEFIIPFDFYNRGSLQVFSQLVTGFTDGFSDVDGGRRVVLNPQPTQTFNARRLEDVARAMSVTEVSTFGAPQGEVRSMILTDYVTRQVRIRRDMRRLVLQDYQGDAGRQLIDGYFQIADRDLQWMQDRAQRDRKIEMYTMIGVGLAALFVPKVGWAISGAIFIGLAADRVATEYRVNGHASTEAWVMLGLSIGTLGMAGIATGLGRAAVYTAEAASGANAARQLLLATRLATASRVVNLANLGVGLGLVGYGTYTGISALRAGRTEEGLVNLGLALFPLVHFGGSRAIAAFRPTMVEPSASVQVARIVEAHLSASEGAVRIPLTEPAEVARVRDFARNPRSLFDFVGEYLSRDAAGRTALLETIPRQIRPSVEALLRNETVLNAARAMREGGPIDINAMRLIRDAIRTFDIPPDSPASGPRGTRPQVDTGGLLNLEGLRVFLSDLMVPDGAPAARLNARAAARARLAAIRAENPDAAGIVDGLLRNPTITQDINTGQSTPFSQRMFGRAMEQLRATIPEDVAAAQQQARVVYSGNLALQAEVVPEPVAATGDGGGMPPVRASIGGQGGRQGPVLPPSPVVTGGAGTQGGTAPRTRGATGGPVPGGEVPAQPGEARPQQPQEVVQIGRFERMWRAARRLVQQRREAASARRANVPSAEQFMDMARSSLDATLRSAARETEIPSMIDEATRGLDPQSAAEVANNIRSAPNRLAELMRALYRMASGGSREQQAAARRAMLKLYSFDNVRAVLTEMARTETGRNRPLTQALAMSRLSALEGARAGRVSLDVFLSGVARRGFESTEMGLVVEALEAEGALRMGAVRERAAAISTREIPALQRQIDAAERAATSARGTNRAPAAEARLETLRQQMVELMSSRDSLNAQIRAFDQQPLVSTEQGLGLRLSPIERAPMLLRMLELGKIPPDAVVSENLAAVSRVRASLRGLDVTRNGPTERGEPQPNPVLEGMRRVMDNNVERSTTADDAVLASLRSDDVAAAVTRRHGAQIGNRFREAVREGSADQVMGRLRDVLPADEFEAISGFSRSARAAIGEDIAVIALLNERAAGIVDGALESAGAYGERLAPARQQLGQVAPVRWGRGALRWMGRGLRTLYWDIGRGGVEQWRDPSSEFSAMPRIRGTGRIIVQLAIWGVTGYYIAREFQDIYRRLSGAATVEEGRREVQREWGISISEANARFVRDGTAGRDFFTYLPNRFPTGRQRRPGNVEELRAQLASQDIIIDPSRMDDVLTDGRTMSGQLAAINTLLATRRTGGADASSEATAELTRILGGFGMTVEAVDRLLAAERKQSLDITDMADLRMDDWVRRGIAVRLRDVVIETFLADSGMSVVRGQGAAQFLSQNQDVFVYLWQAVQSGFLPVSYVDDAVELLMRQGTLAGIRGRVSGTVTLDSQLREALVGGNLIFEVPTGTGSQVQGILQNSFLGLLDRRASLEPAFRPAFEALLARYRGNAAALTAFNGFHVTEGDRGEELYGDMNALAELIIQNPRTAIDLARQRGLVGPALLVQTDPSLRSATDVVQFVAGHSDTAHDRGMLAWIRQRRDQIVSLGPILRDLAGNAQAASMNATDIQAYADRQAERFRTQGWWRGPTPTELAADAERARERARTMPGGQQVVPPTRADQLGAEGRQQYPRRSGFEAAPGHGPGQDRRPAAGHSTGPSLSAEAVSFYNSERSAGLAPFIEGLLTRIYEQTTGDGATLRQTYGEDRDRATREAKAEIYRIITSANPRDATLRSGWGITVTGQGESLTIEIDMRRARDPIRNRVVEFARERLAATGGR